MNLGFHDSEVLSIEHKNNNIKIFLEHVSFDEIKVNVSIEMKLIDEILVDSLPVELMDMRAPDGEVLCIEIDSNSFFALIIWTDFANKKRATHSHQVKCKTIDVTSHGESRRRDI